MERYGGVLHDRVALHGDGDVVVIGPDPQDMQDTVSVQVSGGSVHWSMHLSREQAAKLGAMLTEASADGAVG